jgi:short-subunit dehydrogenase
MVKKTIWITGASDGIGAAIVKNIDANQYNIIISARNVEKLEAVLATTAFTAANSFVLPFDLSERQNYDIIVAEAIKKFATIDILLLNAGVSQKSFSLETREKVERNLLEINYFANVALAKAVTKIMEQQRSGQIIVTSSIVAKFGAPYLSAYSASKAALNNYFESLRFEVEKMGIKILIVTPGFIRTNIDVKAFDGNGEAVNVASKAQEKGTSPDVVAKKIIRSFFSTRKNMSVGGLETWIPAFKFIFPNLFYRLWKKLHGL